MLGARALLTATATALLGALAITPGAAAIALRPCPEQPGFGCGTLRVPLDRTGVVPGTIGLRVAVQDGPAARRRPGLLVALTGGPGQAGRFAAGQFEQTLAPLLRDRRLVVLDQRGTGASGPLDCPAVQQLSALDAFTPAAIGACATRVGPRRRFYTTQDTVADLEALRSELRAPKLALAGVSYGTYVAQQYARVHPDRTERLLLDSVVAPDGVDPFLLDTFGRLGRVLREQCAGARCRRITRDPVADVGALVARLASGSVRGRIFDARGRARTAGFRTAEELFFALIAGDVNPYLQAALPGAIAAARGGDAAPLARLRRVAAGARNPLRELSGGLNVVTGCQDARLPYALTTPLAERPAQAAAALAALDPASYAPWDARTVLTAGYVDDCLRFPGAGAAPAAGPLPAVPTLVLAGRLDLRTPLENGDALAAELPGAERVNVSGTGHDVLDSDATGCADRAVERWARGRPVGSPCAGRTNVLAPFPRPPRGLAAYDPPRGVAGDRGRVLLAVLDTVQDAQVSLLQRLFAGLDGAGGGLRGGRFSAGAGLSALRLTGFSYLRGVRVTGPVTLRRGVLTGRVAVRAPRGLGGVLDLSLRGASGTLGGRAVRFREPSARAARAAGTAPRLAPRAAALRAASPRPMGVARRSVAGAEAVRLTRSSGRAGR